MSLVFQSMVLKKCRIVICMVWKNN